VGALPTRGGDDSLFVASQAEAREDDGEDRGSMGGERMSRAESVTSRLGQGGARDKRVSPV
jgi:hypothetical protein